MRFLWLALVLAPAVALADGDHAAVPASEARFEPPEVGSYELPVIGRVSDATLLGSDGAPTAMLAIAPGELALVSFVYLSCGEACPLATATLHQLDSEIAADAELAGRIQLVTVSFDPERDTPERLSGLAKGLRPQGRWRFVTAESPEAIAPVLADYGQDAVWIPAGDTAPDRLRHVLKIFLVDASGAVRNIYSTGLLDRRLVLNDLRTLLR
jgi:cytochrome oxidase Cu insertion factor (SCO1/SenC/PrrC family)